MKMKRFLFIQIVGSILACCAVILLVLPNSAHAAATIKDTATDATDPSNLADTEPSIAVSPLNSMEIAVVAFSENWDPNDASVMAPVWKSHDGGATWVKIRQIPRPAAGAYGPRDQKIAFDSTGRLLVAEIGGGSCYIYRQTGGPDDPLTAGSAYGDDQPHLEVDKTGGTHMGQAYSPWLNYSLAIPRSMVSYSPDSGITMTDVGAGDNSTFPNRTTRIALAPNGNAYIVNKTREGMVPGVHLPGSTNDDFENVHFRVQRSDNGGATWDALGTAGVSVHGNNTVQTFFTNNFGVTGTGRKVARARSSDAWIAVNQSNGDVYVAYVSRDASTFGQIYVAHSTNQGLNWTSTRITDSTHHCAFPEIAVAGNGTIGVMYIDFEDTGTNTNFRHHFARSFNNGTTWTDQILQSMDPAGIANADSGFLWGDYEGLTVSGHTFYGIFTGESIGRTTAQLDPIFFSETADLLVHPKFPYLYRLCTIVGCLPFKKPWEWYVDPVPDERFRVLVRAGGRKASALKSIQSQTAALTRRIKTASSSKRMEIERRAKRLLEEIRNIGY